MKKLRIWKTPWHVGNDFDIITALSSVADFSLLRNYTRRWDTKNRPLPKNTEWVNSFEKGKYDLAILNIDQQCNLLDLNKGKLTKQMREVIRQKEPSLKVVFINHGTPVYPERYPDGNSGNNFISEILKKEIKGIVKDDFMIVNSHQAKEDWGWGHPLIHGISAKDWKPDTKEPRICAYISAGGIGDKYYNRSYLVDVMEGLKEKYGIMLQWINTPHCFGAKSIIEYKEFIARSLIFFNPTFASPMPRSRTEAMLSGCCIVTTPQHGAADFIEHGKNGFIVPHNDVPFTVDLLAELMNNNYKQAIEVGKRGRETAKELFNYDRFEKDWLQVIHNII